MKKKKGTGVKLWGILTPVSAILTVAAIIGAAMDRTNTRIGKFRPLYDSGQRCYGGECRLHVLMPFIPESMMWLRYVAFTVIYFV